MHPMAPRQLPDRQPLTRVIAPDRLKLLHPGHSFRPSGRAQQSTTREGSSRTEVEPVQASTAGPVQASTPTTAPNHSLAPVEPAEGLDVRHYAGHVPSEQAKPRPSVLVRSFT